MLRKKRPTRQIWVRLPVELYERVLQQAAKDMRSITATVCLILTKWFEQQDAQAEEGKGKEAGGFGDEEKRR